MGKQGSPRSSRSLSFDASPGLKEYQLRWTEMLQNGDPSLGRRASGGDCNWANGLLVKGFKNDALKYGPCKGVCPGKRHKLWLRRHIRSIMFTFMLMGFLYMLDSLMFSLFDPSFLKSSPAPIKSYEPKERNTADRVQEKSLVMYSRPLHMASISLAERELNQKESKFWKEPYPQASMAGTVNYHTGFILASANGGLNQQRVAVCDAVAVASLLNATLVLPKFLYSNVWKDPSQFSDIYQEEAFMNIMKEDVNIEKELPSHLKSIDLEAIGSLVTDADLSKEATPDEYIEKILPILSRNGIVHFLGFGNRLGFDPLPSELQRLRCKCNFHALKFAPKIQKTGSLLVSRIRKYDTARSMLDKQLLGSFISRVDMVAYSMCDFGGGEDEHRELQVYREEHFHLLLERLKRMKEKGPFCQLNYIYFHASLPEIFLTTHSIQSTYFVALTDILTFGGNILPVPPMGRCPLTPEEAALVLAGLGFDSGTYIYLTGSEIYGGKSRMHPINSLYPNVVTKEDLLSTSDLEPFRNFSSQLAALDFIACAASDVFAITDSGSQLLSSVSGFRTYYGGGNAPTLQPSKKRLAAILQANSTIRWHSFENRVRKMIEEGQRVQELLAEAFIDSQDALNIIVRNEHLFILPFFASGLVEIKDVYRLTWMNNTKDKGLLFNWSKLVPSSKYHK
ncbi:hypothetical protein CDL12_20185 [Handroanthus impetiginosus]|uniref:O-fucosyltransferase family protein n=1 Tax=Handroanthus impetiginosus TaxID=429701 RepID=A0A2G9GPV8_9LAMI|nr:hypothetical protein CDL12_20185 [Handroanthus impetiginosus]